MNNWKIMHSLSPRKIVFLHMQKTAGSDIAAQFYQGRLGKFFFPENLRAVLGFLPPHMLEKYSFFYGHGFRNQEIVNIPGEKLLFTFFRDPVERLISHYEWLSSYKLDIENGVIPQPETIPAKMMTCDDFFQSPILNYIPAFNNYYTRTVFEFFSDERTDDIDYMLSVAKNSLQRFDFIGLLDSYGESLDYLGRLLDLRLDDNSTRPKTNETITLSSNNEFHEGGGCFNVSADTLHGILRRNAADIELYEHVRQYARDRFGLSATRTLTGLSTQGVMHRGYGDPCLYSDSEGYVQFGPYERINAGRYAVTFQVRAVQHRASCSGLPPDAVVATLDVVASDGSEREFAKLDVRWSDLRIGEMASFTLQIDLQLPVSRLECRVYSWGVCELECPVSLPVHHAADYEPGSRSNLPEYLTASVGDAEAVRRAQDPQASNIDTLPTPRANALTQP
ncbi:hypothetical protein AB3X91_19045 [Paraburkholderia sp. BR14263]|uniref:hypothetical protein n=1 Tax=unclassified Paraburkholderia TaxID=2615204 RepID=UPI0034CD10A5